MRTRSRGLLLTTSRVLLAGLALAACNEPPNTIQIPEEFLTEGLETKSQAVQLANGLKHIRTNTGLMVKARHETVEATGIFAWEVSPRPFPGTIIRGFSRTGRELFRYAVALPVEGGVIVAQREGGVGDSQFFVVTDGAGDIRKIRGTQTDFLRLASARMAADLGELTGLKKSHTNQCVTCLTTQAGCGLAVLACVTEPTRATCIGAGLVCVEAVNQCDTDPCGLGEVLREADNPRCGLDGARGAGGGSSEVRECVDNGTGTGTGS